jgi:hypothetical protein
MADLKISQLTAISVLTPATDVLPVVDVGGVTKKITTNQILGSGGTATLASATITGAATVGTTLGVTGVTTLTGNAFANGSYAVVAGTPGAFANAAITINNRSGIGDLSLIALGYRPNGTVLNGAAYIGYVGTNDSGTGLGDLILGTRNVTTDTAPTERMRITAAGNVNVATGNVVMSTSGKGIDFSATTSGSGTMTSELLADYEEGTWTGTLTGLTTSPTVAVTTTGRYTKIGREVKVSIYFQGVSTVGASGIMRITGLPFTSANDGVGSIGTFSTDLAATFTGYVVAALGGNSTIIEFASSQSNGAGGFATHNAGLNRYVAATLTYNV